MTNIYGADAAALLNNGYIPLPVDGKKPIPNGWQETTPQQATKWTNNPNYTNANIGLLTGRGDVPLFAADFDFYDPAVAEKVSQAFTTRFGKGLVRYGQAPKLVMLYCGIEQHKKVKSPEWIDPANPKQDDGSDRFHAFELLGTGQQVVAFGEHPVTGLQYTWDDLSPLSVTANDLAMIDPAEVQEWVKDELPKLIPEHFLLRRKPEKAKTSPVTRGDDFFRNVNNEALRHIGDWAPDVFPDGRWSGGAYRVASKDYGRADLQEDLSIHPEGIQNFGEEHGSTAIDLVVQFVDEVNAKPLEAARWLCSQMGVNPKDMGWRDNTSTIQAIESFDELDRTVLHHPTQDNVALLFRKHFNGKLKYAHDAGHWLIWDGTRWLVDSTEIAFNFTREIAREINHEGKSSIGSANFCYGVEQFAKADRAFADNLSNFDQDNYLLNTPNGVVDLRTNTMRPARPEDRLTYCTNVSPTDQGGQVFLKFLDEITLGDEELQEFLRVSLGSCLSGAIEAHWLMFWIGKGRNGKNTLGDLIAYIFGDYAKKVPSDMLVSRKFRGHPTEIANLRGSRLATSSEVEDGDHWDESRLKEITGDATLSGRFMRSDLIQFKRTHKHLIYGNHNPQLKNSGDGISSRLKIVPFKASFIGREDLDLPEKLSAEAGYVLNWLLGGHQRWLELGKKLPPCAAVENESQEYLQSQSTVDAWINEFCSSIDPSCSTGQWPTATLLYQKYKQWKIARGEIPVSMARWNAPMKARFTPVKNSVMRFPVVLSLGADGCSADEFIEPSPN